MNPKSGKYYPLRPLLFLLDYDGTLTDFKKNPEHSRISRPVRLLLSRLQKKHPVILVSGRHVQGLEKVSGLRGFPIVGTHGFEARGLPGGLRLATLSQERLYSREARELWKSLQILKRDYPLVHIERKPFSATVHYRGLRFSKAQITDLRLKFTRIYGQNVTKKKWSLMKGKNMIEALPRGFSKGRSVKKILSIFPGHRPIFAGDDLTDISVMKMLPKKGLRVAVGSRIPGKFYDTRFSTPKQFLSWLKRFT